MKSRYFTILLVIIVFFSGFAQSRTIDSLRNILSIERDDTNKVNTLNVLSEKLWRIGNYDTSLICANSSKVLAEKLYFKKGIAGAFKNIGTIYYYHDDYPKALEYDNKSLAIFQETGDKNGIARNLGNIGIIYEQLGNYPIALEYDFKALAIEQEIGDKNGIARNFGNIGIIYWNQGNYTKALEYDSNALTIQHEIGDKSSMANNLGNIGFIYNNKGNYLKALDYEFKALAFNREIENKNGIANNLDNIGIIYFNQGSYINALEYYNKAVIIFRELGDKNGIAAYLGNIGDVYTKQQKYKQAKIFLDSALTLSKNIGEKEEIKNTYRSIATLDSATGNYKVAFENYKSYITYRDSLINETSAKITTQTEMNYAFEKKEAAAKAEQDRKDLLAIADAKRRKIITGSIILILIMLIMVVILLLQQQRIKYNGDRILSEKENALLKLEKQRMEEELSGSKRLLDNYMENILKKNELLEQFNLEIEKLRNLKSRELYEERIGHLDTLNKAAILTEDDWNKFKEMFEQVHKGFFVRLKERMPDLTPAETRLVCLTKLKLDTKQMAGILGVSVTTIRQTRYRLRKKLGLSEEDNIDDISESI
jgi:tetratricopeptide (TPR) repeat protein